MSIDSIDSKDTCLSSSIFPSLLDFLTGKKVFIFDTETTGLPLRNPGAKFGSRDEYYDHFNNDAYEKSRIVSIAWHYTENFQRNNLNTTQIAHFIRKPDTFTSIDPRAVEMHGITFDIANESGIPFIDIIENHNLGNIIDQCDYIVAHNVMFDIHILMNELYRLNKINHINKILQLLNDDKCICTGEIGKNICKLNYKNKYNTKGNTNGSPNITNLTSISSNYKKPYNPTNKPGKFFKVNYKMPKLLEFYFHLFYREPDNQHSASGDVKALMEIMSNI
jgi:hypothetical protein